MTADLASLERLRARTALRLRLARALPWACRACALSASGASAWLWCEPSARAPLAVAALLSALSFAIGASLPVPDERVSAAIDRAGGLDGRVRAAREFARLAPARQSAFEQAALRDAAKRARALRPAQAAPLHRPRAALPALLAALVCGLLGTRAATPAARPSAGALGSPVPPVRVLERDALAAREETAGALAARASSDARLHQLLLDYLALLARLEEGTLAQEPALQRALALEAALARTHEATEAAAASSDARTEGAPPGGLAAELAKARPELARALAAGAWAQAAEQLRTLAGQSTDGSLDAAQRARLAAALREARERERARVAERAREQERERSLLAGPEPNEPSLLKRRNEQRRELDALRRKRAAQPQRVLDRLERELAPAGAALSEDDAAEARDALERAADALEQQARDERDDATQRELARELAQLREQLQQRALAGDGEPAQRPRQTRGERSTPGESPREGSDSPARRERQLRFDLEARGQRADTPDGGSGLAPRAGGGGEPSQRVLIEERARSVIVARELVSESGGTEHDARQLETPTRGSARYEDGALAGPSGAGPARSEVIRSAAQGGFASAPYRKVYADYRAHEEAVLERERVPAGYRYHVRRYFELVRPRAGQDGRR